MLKTKKKYFEKITPQDLNFVVERSKYDDYYFDQLCNYFEPIIKKIAYRYIKSYKNVDDLIQEGRIGLFYAVKNFDSSKSSNFKIYAIFWIKQSILRSFEKYINTIKIPVRKNKEIRNIKKEIANKNLNQNNYESDDKPIYKNEEENLNTDLLKYDYSYISIEQEYCYNQNEEKFYDRIKSGFKLPDEIIEENETKNFIRKIINNLSYIEKEVIFYRYGLDGRPRLTLKEIGEIFNFSSEAIRKMEIRILNKLKAKARAFSQFL